jgi:hypothetical protein
VTATVYCPPVPGALIVVGEMAVATHCPDTMLLWIIENNTTLNRLSKNLWLVFILRIIENGE